LLVELYQAAVGGCAQRVEEIQQTLIRLRRIYTVGHGVTASVQGIKCGLAFRGICEDNMAEPFSRLSAEERGQVETILRLENHDATW
jgi:4-hydroxy-tetrahydrodipicolinate synthase